MKNNEEKIYGIYPGCLSRLEEIENFSELDFYEAIDYIGGIIWRCNHDMADGRIEVVDLTELQYALEYLVDKTRKFGVELPEPEPGKHLTPSKSYLAWFQFYYNHFHYTLTDEEWNKYQKAKKNKEDISKFMPKGSWKDLLEEEKEKTR